MFPTLINSLRETLYMVLYSGLLSILIGVPLGVLIASIAKNPRTWVKSIYLFLDGFLQLSNSIPYLLMMLLFIPITNKLIAHNISYITATILPLAITGTLMLAHSVNKIFQELMNKWHSTTKALGATTKQTMLFILFPESFSSLINAIAATSSSLVGFSIIAGALGAGGLGQLAIEKSIQDPNPSFVIACIALLVAIQQLFKYTGLLVVQHTEIR